MTPIRNAMLREHFMANYLEDVDPNIIINNFESYSDVLACPEAFPNANIQWLKVMVPELAKIADWAYDQVAMKEIGLVR